MKAIPAVIKTWRQAPQSRVSVIVHTEGEPTEYVERIQGMGIDVIRIFRLTRTVAAQGAAQDILDLLDETWVVKIEPDQPVSIMS
jgi:hypothetical protein